MALLQREAWIAEVAFERKKACEYELGAFLIYMYAYIYVYYFTQFYDRNM